MKKIIMFVFMIVAGGNLAIANDISTSSGIPPTSDKQVNQNNAEQVEMLKKRLDDLKSMDMSTLTKEERKEKRKEVRKIKKELKTADGGIYLSAGALIIIAILLILLL